MYCIQFYYPLKANATDYRYWSLPAIGKNRTFAKLPDNPPKTTPGSFEIIHDGLGTRKVIAYWQKIPRQMENGPDFGYTVTEVSENGYPR